MRRGSSAGKNTASQEKHKTQKENGSKSYFEVSPQQKIKNKKIKNKK
tara:strand:+ start:1406 stop:1546 length:141 start_codon:yes stop_codon:yes gene_type:complete